MATGRRATATPIGSLRTVPGRRPQAETTEAERPTDEDVDPVRGPENPSADEPRIEDENPDRHSEEP